MFAAAVALVAVATASAYVHPPRQIHGDKYRNTTSQHSTQVEPDSFAYGQTIVVAAQTGRFLDGGGSNVAWATSTDGGFTWTKGNLPGTTVFATPPGPYARVSDPAVAYDPEHDVWMISTLGIDSSVSGEAVLTSRSTDGGLTWSNPVVVDSTTSTFFDKNWIVCDTWATSPHYGNCYTEWDDNGLGNQMMMSTSTDGGLTWGPTISPPVPSGLGGQPVVQPNGTVVVPYTRNYGSIAAFRSIDGGASWTNAVQVSSQSTHNVAGGLRDPPLPSAEVDANGKVYVAWHGCQFRSGCSANDIVYSTSTDGIMWSPLARIPIDPVTSTVDHFLPGIGVDRAPGSQKVAVTYYYYPVSNCTTSTCQLTVGVITSVDGGATWNPPILDHGGGPMNLSWIANTTQGRMVGDYVSTSFTGDGDAHPVFVSARDPFMGFREAMFVSGIAVTASEDAVPVRSEPTYSIKPQRFNRGMGVPELPTSN
jgi:hypothetical protein